MEDKDKEITKPFPESPSPERAINYKKILSAGFWIVVIVAIGMFAVNQTFDYYYKAEFLKAPCNLCMELNPEISEQCFVKEDRLFPNNGRWQFENGSDYQGYVGVPSVNWSLLNETKE